MLFGILLIVIPVWALVYAIIGVCGYVSARKQAQSEPSEAAEENLKKKKRSMIIALIIAGVLLSIIVGLIVLLATAVAYM